MTSPLYSKDAFAEIADDQPVFHSNDETCCNTYREIKVAGSRADSRHFCCPMSSRPVMTMHGVLCVPVPTFGDSRKIVSTVPARECRRQIASNTIPYLNFGRSGESSGWPGIKIPYLESGTRPSWAGIADEYESLPSTAAPCRAAPSLDSCNGLGS